MPENVVKSAVLETKLAAVHQQLVEVYGIPEWRPDGDALGGLVGTILSQHTSDVNSERAYQRLIHKFSTWEAARDAPVEEIEEAIRPGGLGRLKAERIQRVLRDLTARLDGAPPSLAVLDDLTTSEAEHYLRTLPGVGPKTAACVLLFSLGRPAFPVDTHVLRVCQRLGLVSADSTAAAAHEGLGHAIPERWRHPLHVNLIRHGRQICSARRPQCPRCPMKADCDYFWRSVNVHSVASTGRP